MRIFNFLTSKVGDLTKKFANLPDSYIKRSMEQVYWRTPKGYPQYMRREVARRKFKFTTARPWSMQFRQANALNIYPKKVFVEPIAEWSFFKGDRVEVLVGRDKGKQGIVTQVIQERNWVIVEGLNTHIRRVGKEEGFPGIVLKSEAPLLVTNQVKLVDPETLQPTEIEWRFTEEGDKVRVSSSTSRIIPIPVQAYETKDYKSKNTYLENPIKDTTAATISDITYKPAIKTFEMDIMENMGIKEDRTPAKSYWY